MDLLPVRPVGDAFDFVLKILEALDVPCEVFLPATNVFDNDSVDLCDIVPTSVASFWFRNTGVDRWKTFRTRVLQIVQGRRDILIFGA